MVSAIQNLILKIFGGNSYFATFFISMIPLIELKGAIPFGMSKEFFPSTSLSPFEAWVSASAGATIPAFFLVWIFPLIFNRFKNLKFFKGYKERIESKADAIKENKKKLKRMVLLTLFVALPLPLTGAYTGSVIASLSGVGYFSSVLCIFIGNIIAGGLVTLLCTIFRGYETYILLGFFIVLAVVIAVKVIQMLAKRRKNAKEKASF